MIRNYFKIAFRNMFKDGFYSFINIIGLSIGITACLLIMLYVNNELSYDKFHKDHERIYRITTKAKMSETQILNVGVSSAPMAEQFKRDLEEIEAIARLYYNMNATVKHNEDVFKEKGVLYADSTFFDVFDFGIQQGNPKSMLVEPYSVVMTEETAIRFFGERKVRSGAVMEEKIQINNDLYQVTGILDDVPQNSHFTFDMLLSMSSFRDALNPIWLTMNYYTYLKLKEGVDPASLDDKIRDIVMVHVVPQVIAYMKLPEQMLSDRNNIDQFFKFSLQPMTSIHLHSNLRGELGANSDIKYIYIFSSIALFIIIIACINFMNLATARASKRAIEVGIRKTLGSFKGQLVKQFMVESILFSLIAMIIALGLTEALKYPFSAVTGKILSLNIFNDPSLLLMIVGLVLVIGLTSGAYPAFYLTRFKPVEVLKGSKRLGGKRSIFRNSLVVLQFAISFGLIVCTSLVFKQMGYLSDRNLGFDKENVIVLTNGGQMGNRFEVLKNELDGHPEVISVASSMTVPSGFVGNLLVTPEGKDAVDVPIYINVIDHDFIDTYKMEMVQGRNFSRDFTSDSTGILVNEQALRLFGWGPDIDPVDRYVDAINPDMGTRTRYTIVGVVKDFNYESCKSPISAQMMLLGQNQEHISIRVKPGNMASLAAGFKPIWKKIAPDVPYEHFVLKDNFEELYQAEQKMSELFTIFTSIAIFIACLGLLGLAAYTAEQRTKEIGIRKVMGASVPSVIQLLNLQFIKLVLISIVIASPIAWYLMTQWLGSFVYKTEIGPGPFVIATLIALSIAIITVGYQSFKAAIANPVNSLKTE